MRAFALLLILANVIFFAWQQRWLPWLPWQPPRLENVTPSAVTKTSLTQLTLLNERQAVATTPKNSAEPAAVPADTSKSTPPKIVAEKPVEKPVNLPVSEVTAAAPKIAAEEPSKNAESSDTHKTIAPVDNPTQKESAPGAVVETPLVQPDKEVATKDKKETPAVTNPPPVPVVAVAETPAPQTVAATKPAEESHVFNPLTATTGNKTVLPPPVTPAAMTEKPETGASSEKKVEETPKKGAETAVPKKEPPRKKDSLPKKALTQTPAKSKVTDICLRVGPFAQMKTAENTSKWFEGRKNISAQVQKRQTAVLKRTQVYFPPFKNRTEALNAQNRLIQQGIADHFVLANHSISLGIYRDQLSVKRRLEELGSKGYKNVKTEKYYESDTKYWLSVKIPVSQSNLVNAFKKESKGLPMTSAVCEE